MTINVNNNSTITEVLGNRTNRLCKPVINKTTGEVYASATDAAEAIGVTVHCVSHCCLGKTKSCKGNRLSYLSHTSENVDELTAQIRILNAKIAELEEDAAVGRAVREEQEAARKAEEERNAAIAKAEAKLERCRRIVAAAEEKYMLALQRFTDAERELSDLKGDDNK